MAIQIQKPVSGDGDEPNRGSMPKRIAPRNEMTRKLGGTESRYGENQYPAGGKPGFSGSSLNPGDRITENSDLVFRDTSVLDRVMDQGAGRSDQTENQQTRSLGNIKNVPDHPSMASARARQATGTDFGVHGGLPSKPTFDASGPVRKPTK